MEPNEHLVESTQLPFATAQNLFAISGPKRRYREVDLPTMGVRLRLQSLTERELAGYHQTAMAKDGQKFKPERLLDATRRLIVLCLVDPAGNRLLNESHIAKLADWDAADTQYLYNQCAEHVGISTKDVEDLVGNSGATIA